MQMYKFRNVQITKIAVTSAVGNTESPNLMGFHWNLTRTAGCPEPTLPIQFQHCYIINLLANRKRANNTSQNLMSHTYIIDEFLFVEQHLQSVAFRQSKTEHDVG